MGQDEFGLLNELGSNVENFHTLRRIFKGKGIVKRERNGEETGKKNKGRKNRKEIEIERRR